MNNHIGDGILENATTEINSRLDKVVNKLIKGFFDYIEESISNLPDKIKQMRNSTKTKQKITELWSELLFEEGLIPKGYKGLPDNLLISNFHQDGYLDGLYVGYILAMMALVDNEASKETIIATRDYVLPKLLYNYYNNRDEIVKRFREDDKYNWIEKEK